MELLLLTISNSFDSSHQPGTQYAFWWFLCIASPFLFGSAILLNALNLHTKCLVILGSKGVGKTTLWNQLRGLAISNTYEATAKENIESFTIRTENGKTRKISSSTDVGGSDLWVANYEQIIKENKTFVFFLVNLTNAKEKKMEIRARLVKILKIIEDKKLDDCGISILGTFRDQCTYSSTENICTYLKEILDLNSIPGLKEIKIRPVNLLSDNDIKEIKQIITN